MSHHVASRCIGLIGGMSWESTVAYYQVINRRVAQRLGGLHSARIVLVSVDFAEVARLQAAGEWDVAGDLLAEAARGLERAGADIVLIGANTMHKVADAVDAATSLPLLHVVDVTSDAAHAAGASRVGLLGTAFTMEQDFYRDRLERNGLQVLIPGADDRADLHRIIYDELCKGVIRDESRDRVQQFVDALVAQGAQAVILGCTELELLLDPDGPGTVPLLPTARLHGQAAADWAVDQVEPGRRRAR